MFYILKAKNLIFSFLALLFISGILLFPDICISAAKDGLNLSLYLILPSLFPFAVISSYISTKSELPNPIRKTLSKFLNLSENAVMPFILGLISGYPIGAVLTAEAVKSGKISVEEGNHLLPFCNACGPLFLIGVAGGGMFGSYKYGYFLLLIQTISIFLSVLIFRFSTPHISQCRKSETKTPKYALVSALDKSIGSIFHVFSAVIFFSVVCAQIRLTGIFENLFPVSSIGYGIIEVTNGLNRLALSDIPIKLKLSLASALCGFSGLCILIQVQSAVQGTNIKIRKYILFKLVISAISFVLSWVAFPLFPSLTPTFNLPTHLSFAPFETGSYVFISLFTIIYGMYRKITKVSFFDNR